MFSHVNGGMMREEGRVQGRKADGAQRIGIEREERWKS